MPEGGSIILNGRLVEKQVELRIHDEGNGVPEIVRDKLFRELIPKDKDRDGMGIGGLLAATIIEEHDGHIELENTNLPGTTVLIRLPTVGEVG